MSFTNDLKSPRPLPNGTVIATALHPRASTNTAPAPAAPLHREDSIRLGVPLSMQLSSHLSLELIGPERDREAYFRLTGPPVAIRCLQSADAPLRGIMSRLTAADASADSAITHAYAQLGESSARSGRATTFGFAYPMQLDLDALLLTVRKELGQGAVENPPAWLDFVMYGGFTFFGPDGTFVDATRTQRLKSHEPSHPLLSEKEIRSKVQD